MGVGVWTVNRERGSRKFGVPARRNVEFFVVEWNVRSGISGIFTWGGVGHPDTLPDPHPPIPGFGQIRDTPHPDPKTDMSKFDNSGPGPPPTPV